MDDQELVLSICPLLLFVILIRNTSSNFFSCALVNSIIREKSAYYQPFKNGQFVGVSADKIIDHQYRENGTCNI